MALSAASKSLIALVLGFALSGCGNSAPAPSAPTATGPPPANEPGKGRPAKESIGSAANGPGGAGKAIMPGGGPTNK